MAKKILSETSEPQSLRVLMVEDSEDDALLTILELKKGGYEPVYERVEDAMAMRKALLEKIWDVILCDYQMPQFNGFAAINLLKETGIDIPLIIVSGAIGEETAVECMRLGACDYIMKSNLTRLVPAIKRELKEAESRIQRKRAEEALRESERKYKLITEKMTDIVWIVDMDFRTIYVTPSVLTVLGFSQEERMLQSINEQLTPDSLSSASDALVKELALKEQGHSDSNRNTTLVLEYYHKDGSTCWLETIVSGLRNDLGVLTGIHGVSRDITERKHAEEALRESEELFRSYLEYAPDGVYINDLEGNFLYGNRKCEEITGYRREELIGKNFLELNILSENSLNKAAQLLQANMDGKSTGPDEIELIIKEGRLTPVEINTTVVQRMGQRIVLSFVRDITDRKQAEKALRESEEKYRTILDNIEDGYFEIDIAGNLTFFNDSVCRMIGNTRAELMGMNNRQYTDKENSQRLYQAFNKVFTTGEPSKGVDYEIIGKDGTKLYIESSVSLIRNASGQPIGFRGIMRNITERKRAEENLKESKELTEAVVENVPLMIFLKEAVDLRFVIFNRAGEELLGYDRKALLGKNNLDLFPPEQAAYFMAKDREVLDGEAGMLDIPEEPIQTAKKGQRLLHTRKICIRGADGATKYLLGISEDITERKQSEEQLKKTLESLRKAVGTTIQVMVSAVESRDPYTAGHQNRSADLARAIATEMGVSQDIIEAIRMAGPIHDIGKLSVPAEILSKPGKLSAIEFSLVKEHARTGFEILKNVESPWPLAQIVYQHHERMDGSGYPRNLKGEEILIEARIMAVADVVESMASHRPYRPALGINAALEEIEKNKKTLYDDTVADACLRLFREKGFQFEGA